MWILKLILITVIICIIFSPIWILFFYLRDKLEKIVEEREKERIDRIVNSSFEQDDEDEYDYYDDEYDDEDYDDEEESDYGKYVIQYRTGYGGWIDGPGSNSEQIAERMFDNFVSKEMSHRNAVRARLVKINNGRVISILGTS